MSNKTLTVEKIRERGQHEDLTPYQIARLLNDELTKHEIMKDGEPYQVRPQMIYNYDKNGMIAEGKKETRAYSLEESMAFIDKFVSKRKPKTDAVEECEGQMELVEA